MKIKDFRINRIKVPLQGCMTAARIALTMCLSLALCLSMSIPKLSGGQTASLLTELLYNIQVSLIAKGGLVTPLFFILLYVNRKIDARKTGFKLLFPLVSGFIALIWLMGEGFRIDNTLRALHSSLGQAVKSCVYFAGITYGMNQLAHFLYGALEKQGATCLEDGLINRRTWQARIVRAYREHTLLVSFAAVFILWLPHLILSYPANMCWDAYSQLSQFLGISNYSNHHPIASTLMMGALVKIGSLVSGNFGAFFYILVQGIIGAWVLAYTLYLMRELDAPIWLRILSFACYVFVPYYTGYIGMFLKDVPYSFAALLFVSELIYLLIKKEDFFRSKRHILLMAVSIAGVILLRNNGRYMLYPTLATVLLYLFFRTRKANSNPIAQRRFIVCAIISLFVPVLLTAAFSAAIVRHLNIAPGSIREALSLPMQQTARYVKEYGDEVTEEEKAAISAVLDYERLAQIYDPRISDPVKGTFKWKPSKKELKNYFVVWLKQFVKHPFVYVKATVNQNYYLLYPFTANANFYVNHIADSTRQPNQSEVVEALNWHDVEPIASLKSPLRAFDNLCFYLPVLNLLSHPAFYVLLLIWLSVFAFYRKRFLWLLASVPIWLSTAIVVLAPVIQGHPRYAFPIIYSMPVMLAYFLYLGKAEKTNG